MDFGKIKLVVSDLDGTMFNSDVKDYKISNELHTWIKRMSDNGVAFTIATGRPEFSSLWVARELQLELPYIAYNGGMIIDKEGKVIYSDDFLLEPWLHLIKSIDAIGGTVLLYLDDGVYYYRWQEAVKTYENKEKVTCRAFEQCQLENVYVKKILLVGDNDTHKKLWDNHLTNELQASHRYLISEHNYMEIVDKRISKGYGLKILSHELGLKSSEILGIGNQMNDKELLEESGIGVAVDNASSQLKSYADIVTEGAYEKGVIEVLKKLSMVYEKGV